MGTEEIIDKIAARRANTLIQLASEANKNDHEHEHEWKLTEDGYTRTWSTEIRDDGTIVAYYGGSEDWSENGNGTMYLQCSSCLAINEDFDYDNIDYQ